MNKFLPPIKKSLPYIFLLIFFFFTRHAYAQVVINEVYPAPSQNNEWLELYNPATTEIDLNGWSLEDQLNSPTKIYKFETQTLLAPDDYFIVELPTPKLNNDADGVTLKNPQGEIVNTMSYGSSTMDLSWSLTTNGTYLLTAPTKGMINISSTPTPTPSPTPTVSPTPPPDISWHQHIQILEFMACPETGQDEWIKLYNDDSQPHQLFNWQIKDASGQSKTINETIAANDHVKITWPDHLFRDRGETIYLIDNLNQTIHQITYQSCTPPTPQPSSIPPTPTPSPHAIATPHPPTPTPSSFPIPPKSHLILDQLVFSLGSTQIVATPAAQTTISYQLPQLPTLSVILGGSLLLFSGSWQTYEKLKQLGSLS